MDGLYAEFNGDVHWFCFWPQISLLGKFCPNIQNCLFKVKFDTKINSNMHECVHFISFRLKILVLGKFGPKIQIASLSWKLVLRLMLIWSIQWRCSVFLFSTGNFLFFWNICWSRNLEPRSIGICIMWWWFSFFFPWEIFFLVNLVKKFKRVSLKRNLTRRLIWIRKIWWWCLLLDARR